MSDTRDLVVSMLDSGITYHEFIDFFAEIRQLDNVFVQSGLLIIQDRQQHQIRQQQQIQLQQQQIQQQQHIQQQQQQIRRQQPQTRQAQQRGQQQDQHLRQQSLTVTSDGHVRLNDYIDVSHQEGSGDSVPGTSQQGFEEPGTSQTSKPYRIVNKSSRSFVKTAAVNTTYKIKFDDQWKGQKLVELHDELHDMFTDILSEAKADIEPNDLAVVIVDHESLDNSIVVPLQPAEQIDANSVMSKIQNVLQSEESLTLNESVTVTVGTIHMPKATGKRIKSINLVDGPNNSLVYKNGFAYINNDDKLCMAKSIAACWCKIHIVSKDEWKQTTAHRDGLSNMQLMLKHRKLSQEYYKDIHRSGSKLQDELAVEFCRRAHVSTQRAASLDDIAAFEEALNVRICVFCATLGNKIIRSPHNDHPEWPLLYLYLTDHTGTGHFHGIVSITGVLRCNYFCEKCLTPFDHFTNHTCDECCMVCKSMPCVKDETQQDCPSCNMHCRNNACFRRHREVPERRRRRAANSLLSDCERYWRCPKCKKVIDKSKRDLDKKPHNCSEYFCKVCKSWVDLEHLCYLRASKPKTSEPNFIFLDYETSQNTTVHCENGYTPGPGCNACSPDDLCSQCKRCTSCKIVYCGREHHVPLFAIAQSVCGQCLDKPFTPQSKCIYCGTRCDTCKADKNFSESCTDCGVREVQFSGIDTATELGRWLFSEEHANATIFAHNMRSFDGIFLLDYMLKQSMRPSKIIYNGSKIMYMEVQRGLNIRILDSLNFLPMKLGALPQAFDLEQLQKGYFPHLFNTGENHAYEGTYPDVKYYDADSMNSQDREAFLQWHRKQLEEGAVFNLRQEMEAYCRSDVEILRQACLKFRQLMLDVTENKVDSFQHITIASTCMTVYKTMFLEEDYHVKLEKSCDGDGETGWLSATCKGDKWRVCYDGEWVDLSELDGYSIKAKKFECSPLAQVSPSGYSSRDNYSKTSIEWLEYLVEKSQKTGKPIHIRHALNGGELRIPATRYRVDGYCSESNTVYEFNGCLWHGCPTCYEKDKRRMRHPRTAQSMEELYALTMEKRTLLRQMGYKYVSIWEHEFLKQKTSDPELQSFVNGLNVQPRLNPRDSFFGGRTNACKLYFNARDDEKVSYVDVTSLYPYVNAYCRYPVGHPEIVTGDFKDLNAYFGIAKVKILPPRGLYHPVLPYRSQGKLKFPLCRTCADEERLTPCQHNTDRRALTGTWCTPELHVAIDKGYKVLAIYEVYHWDQTTCYDPTKKEGGLFIDYINTFLKLKQESSGYPDWCSTPDDKRKYVSDYLSHQGIQLDETKIEKNPGLRSLAKLCLNSFWGKFGQRTNLTQTDFFHDCELDKFYKALTDPTKLLTNFHIVNEHTIQLEWVYQPTFVPEDAKTNIFIASFTTTHARLKLYEILDKLQTRVLYFDTDSVIYSSKPGDYHPPQGDFLGDLTDELGGDYITEFVSAGPKNYAYKTSQGKQVCKIRGFTLNYANSNILNLTTIRDMVTNLDPENAYTFSKKRKASDDAGTPVTKKRVITLVNPRKICREKSKNVVFNREEKKEYSVVYTKRVIQPDLDTLPFGF